MIRRLLKYISAVGFVISLGLIIYGTYGPYYETAPLNSSFTFTTEAPQNFKFKVDKSDRYMIEIHLKNVLSDKQMNTILGNFVKGGTGGEINIEWYLHEGNETIANGSNKKYSYSPIFGGSYSGLSYPGRRQSL